MVWVVPLSGRGLTPAPPFAKVYNAKIFGVGRRTGKFPSLNPKSVALPFQQSRLTLDCGQLWQEPAITGLDWLFTPILRSGKQMHLELLQASTKFYLRFTLPKNSSPSFGLYPSDSRHFHTSPLVACGRLVALRIRPKDLFSPLKYTPWQVIRNLRQNSEEPYQTITIRFQVLLTSDQGYFSTFLHSTRTLSVLKSVQSWMLISPKFLPHSQEKVLKNCPHLSNLLLRGCHPLWRLIPEDFESVS